MDANQESHTTEQGKHSTPFASRWHPYPTYKPSGVAWLGDIPAHWEARRLKFIAPASISRLEENPRGLPYLGLENIESKTGRILPNESVENPEGTANVFEPGNVLFGKLRPYLAKVAHPEFRGVCTTELLVLRPQQGLDAKFLMYQLLSDGFVRLVDSFTYGAKMPRASGEQIENVGMPLPPLPEQRAIAAFLHRQTAKLDNLIAKKERLIELLQEKRTALISHAVTKGLDPNAQMKDSGVEWLGQVPAHWQVLRNVELFRQRDERGHPELPLLQVGIGMGVVVREFSDEHIEQKAADPATYKVARAGDIAFNKMRMWQGAVGVAPVDGLVSPDYIVAEPNPAANPYYFAALFRTGRYKTEVNRYSHGIVDDRNRLYWDDFKQIKSIAPPRREQDRIVEFIDRETAKIDALVAKVRQAIETLREYRTALVSAAVTGKIDVRAEGDLRGLENLEGLAGRTPASTSKIDVRTAGDLRGSPNLEGLTQPTPPPTTNIDMRTAGDLRGLQDLEGLSPYASDLLGFVGSYRSRNLEGLSPSQTG